MKNLLILVCASLVLPGEVVPGSRFAVNKGTASFLAETNVSAVSIHGSSDKLEASALARREGGKLVLEGITAKVEAQSLSTGMGLRDSHMRERILKAADGSLPPLQFHTERAQCPEPVAGQPVECIVNGQFAMRGVTKPFQMTLKLKADAKQLDRLRITGEGGLRLSEYGIGELAPFGVKVTDWVKLKVDFLAQELAERSQK